MKDEPVQPVLYVILAYLPLITVQELGVIFIGKTMPLNG